MANFSEIPWIAEHVKLYQTDPEKAHMWNSTLLGGPGPLPTLLLTTCELMVGPKSLSARARVAEGEERKRLWEQMAQLYPPYNEYQERAGERTIPVVVLDPVG
jgi:hypothetical protein